MSEWKQTEFGQIPIEWDVKKIIDLKSKDKGAIAMGPFGSNIKAENFVNDGVPVIRGTNLNFNKYVGGDFVFLSEAKADELKGSNCKAGDLVFTHRGTIGQVGIIPEGKYSRYVISQSGMKLTVDKNIIDTEFLFYFFKSRYGQHQLLKSEAQVGVPSISNPLSTLKQIEVPVPDLVVQKNISNILSVLDCKIDLLQRQIETIEKLTATLFRQWFVEEAEQEWEVKSLDEIATYLNGLALQKFPSNGIDFLPVIKIKELNQGITENSDRCSREVPPQYIIQDGDVLFSWSGSLEVVIWHDGEGALNQHLFKVSSENYPKWFYYLATKYHLPEFRMIAESKSTTMGHIQREHLKQALISIPPPELFKQYGECISPLIEKITRNNAQIKALTKQRDTLLPKLMSGEVIVSN